MNPLKAIIIEDEPLSVAELRAALAEVAPGIEVVATAASVAEAVRVVGTTPHDLLFMDIHLGDGSSFDLFERADIRVPVIFITAYDTYALKAFENKGIDYLLKPFGRDDLERALGKLELLASLPVTAAAATTATAATAPVQSAGAGSRTSAENPTSTAVQTGTPMGTNAAAETGAAAKTGATMGTGTGTPMETGAPVRTGAAAGTGAAAAAGTTSPVPSAPGEAHPVYQERFLVHMGARMRSVTTAEIAYFRADGKYLHLATHDGKDYIVDRTLTEVGEKLSPVQFFRINRRYIISFDAIREMLRYSGSRIKVLLNPPLPEGEEAFVSTDRVQDFRRWLDR